jgi:hypothetical protein
MPELHSGMTQEYRAFQASRKIDIGRQLEEFVGRAVPDIMHMWVLARLVECGPEGASLSHLRTGIEAPKSDVTAALGRFEKLGLLGTRGLIGKKYFLPRGVPGSDLALRLVKLWKHPQGHQGVLDAIKKRGGG